MRIEHHFELNNYNSYKIAAVCKRAFFPTSENDFIEIYKNIAPDSKKIILGGGYNVILSKNFYEEDFIIIGESFSSILLEKPNKISCEAGTSTEDFSLFALDHGLTGAEIFYDIPSSIGGAVVMNAGASGEEIKDILVKVRYLDLADFKIKEIDNKEIGFSYRNSFFQLNTDKIVLKAWFELNSGDKETIRLKMDQTKEARWAKQPKNLPNAGSVFKRPVGHYVGPMIDKLGLKGFTIGGAKVSELHSGFIVNFNNASGQDIIDIINHVKLQVLQEFKVDLEVEQRIL